MWSAPWPLKSTENTNFECTRCKQDKSCLKKFSKDNNMIPPSIPLELQNVTPVMQIHCIFSGCLNCKGHIKILPHKIQKIEDILPNCPKHVPLMFCSLKGKHENPKLYQVRREIVFEDFYWLVLHKPSYKDVVIDESCLESFPEDGSIEVKSIFLEQEEESYIFPGMSPSNNF